LKHIALAAVAGISTSNIKEFYDAGAIAFGISSSLYLKEAIIKKDFAKVTDSARAFYDSLKE
jgi:2-keto-3-deoxy-6-phosphogluconate aldolase